MTATPPTTPPTMAPMGADEPPDLVAAAPAVALVVEDVLDVGVLVVDSDSELESGVVAVDVVPADVDDEVALYRTSSVPAATAQSSNV